MKDRGAQRHKINRKHRFSNMEGTKHDTIRQQKTLIMLQKTETPKEALHSS